MPLSDAYKGGFKIPKSASSRTAPGNETGRQIHIGQAIRMRRKQLGLTLREVSEQTKLSVGFLSQVERNLTSPSLSSLINIAAALEVNLDYFLTPPDGAGMVSRTSERSYFSVEGSPVQYARVTKEFPGCQFHGVLVRVPPGYEAEQNQHVGEDLAYVVSGRCWVKVGDKVNRLQEGDAIHYQATIPHSYGNDYEEECLILSLNTMPLFGSKDS